MYTQVIFSKFAKVDLSWMCLYCPGFVLSEETKRLKTIKMKYYFEEPFIVQ